MTRCCFAACAVALLATACTGGDDGGTVGGADGAAMSSDLAFCVEETNRYRAMDGRSPLARSQALEDFANDSARIDTQSRSAHSHFVSTNGGGIAFAENECPSFLGWTIMGDARNSIAECVAEFYGEGPGGGHYENMMGNYAALGCGVFIEGNGITIVQDFGN